MNTEEHIYVGVDVGGTNILGCVVDLRNSTPSILGVDQVPIRANAASAMEDIRRLCSQLIQGVRSETGRTPAAVGVGLAGLVGHDGIVVRSPNVPGIEGVDVGRQLNLETGLPVFIENDANCVAVRAASTRSPRGQNLVAITLGTGIGGGIIAEGSLLRGSAGFAGEPGHMVVQPGGEKCRCGQHGCWERYASGSAIARMASDAGLRRSGDGGAVSAEEVVELARLGDQKAIGVMNEFAGWLAHGISNLAELLDPAAVVLGGGVAESSDVFLDTVRRLVSENPHRGAANVQIEVATDGASAGAIGAAMVAESGMRVGLAPEAG